MVICLTLYKRYFVISRLVYLGRQTIRDISDIMVYNKRVKVNTRRIKPVCLQKRLFERNGWSLDYKFVLEGIERTELLVFCLICLRGKMCLFAQHVSFP